MLNRAHTVTRFPMCMKLLVSILACLVLTMACLHHSVYAGEKIPAEIAYQYLSDRPAFRNIPEWPYYIVNRESGKVLDIPGGTTKDGVRLQQYTASGSEHEQWYIRPDRRKQYDVLGKVIQWRGNPPDDPYNAGRMVIINRGTGKVLAAKKDSGIVHQSIYLSTTKGQEQAAYHQTWAICTLKHGDFFSIRMQNSPGATNTALDVANGSKDNEAPVNVFRLHEHTNQQWTFIPVGSGEVYSDYRARKEQEGLMLPD